MEIGNKIMNLRKKSGLSQEELGEKLGVARQTISKWELGETSPDLKQAKELSKIFNVSLDELVDNDVKDVLVEKTSNTEQLAGLILKLLKIIIGIIIIIPILYVILGIIFSVRNRGNGDLLYTEIDCVLHEKEYHYGFHFYETTGQIKYAGGDGYLANVTDIEKYGDAYKAIDIIDAYVRNNGGTCEKSETTKSTADNNSIH